MAQSVAGDVTGAELETALAGVPSLSRLLEVVVEAHGDRVAVLDSNTGASFTYKEFGRRVRATAYALQHQGVKSGDRVAIALPNGWQYAVTYFAIQAAGAVAVLVNIRFTEGEIEHVLSDSGSVVVVTDPELRAGIPSS